MLTTAGALTLAIWVYLTLFRGRFWRIALMVAPPSPKITPAQIAVIIPARDEADIVARSVISLLNQEGDHSINVFLVDDSSSDGTAEVAREAGRTAGKSEQLTVIHGAPLDPGWSGKLWAVQQGVEQAGATGPDFLLLTDADIVHAPDSVAALAAIAQSRGFDLVSVMVRLYCRSLAERALIPAFVFFFLKLYPPAWIANPNRRTAGAAGGSILIRPEALKHAGGIQAIRGEVIDDCALARRVKQSGGRVWLGLAPRTESIRPYGTFAEIGRMISRGAFNQLKHSFWMLLLALLGLTATYLLPPLLLICSRCLTPALLGGAAWLLMAVCFFPHNPLLPPIPAVGSDFTFDRHFLYGRYHSFSRQVLDWARWAVERKDSGSTVSGKTLTTD